MTSSLRVLTYNVQMRSWGMEVGAQKSLTPYTSVEDRAKAISKRILDGVQQYDIVCLQEVFDEDGRGVFKEALSAAYPHNILKSDRDGMLVVSAGAAGVAAVAATIPGGAAVAVIAGVVGLIAANFSKFEDSGLMLFSKLPFARLPVSQEFRDAAAANTGINLPASLPLTVFEEYEEAGGEDKFAAKGVLYAHLMHDTGPIHLMVTHTQADATGDPAANLGHPVTRQKQLQQAYDLLSRMTGDTVRESEVLFCGDFNVDGMKHPAGYFREWTQLFDTPGGHYTDDLIDSWTREQCPGDPGPGRTPLPPDFDRGMTAQIERLDYAIRSRGPSRNRLLLQHMCIAYDIATDPAAPTAYTSDHLPVRIDLDLDRPHASVLTAEPIPPDIAPGTPSVIPFGGDATVSDFIMEGQMHWYRISEPGGYKIALTEGEPRVHLDVYTADNLSVPVAPFSTLDDPATRDQDGRTRYALPTAPFYLRVSLPDRRAEARYEVRVHRYGGTGPFDAIPLLRGIPQPGVAKVGAPHSLDNPATPFSEHDAIWFIAPFDTYPDGSLHVTSTVTVADAATRAFGVLVLGHTPDTLLERMAEEGARPEVTVSFGYDRPMTGYILVRREDPTFAARAFTVTLRSDVSYLYGNPVNPASRARAMARLFCRDETNGAFGSEWGSDDIQINVAANARNRVHIPNSDELEFDDDTLRDLPQVDVVRYVGSAEFEVVELDDLSPVDRASFSIPQFDDLIGSDKVVEGNAAGVLVKLTAIFDPADDDDDDDDGIYDLTVTVSAEPPRQI